MFMGNLFVWVFIGVIILGIIVYANPQLWEDAKEKIIKLKNLNPLNAKSCPQINVSIEGEYTDVPIYTGLTISGKTYDGWTVKGIASCRKGTKEGENLNKYYCGGYNNVMGIGSVNAYVEKTTISEEGDIGKTEKYVIWNIYDENKNFIETRCLGNPDEFEEKQAKTFYNELLKWD